MPRLLRIVLTGLSFAIFFLGSMLLGVVVVPALFAISLGNREKLRDRCTRFIGWGYGTFLFWMRMVGLITWTRPSIPRELEGRAYVLVANHPTLIDVLFLLHWFPGLTSVAKASWYDSMFLGSLLRAMHYIPGPRTGEVEGTESPVLDRMVAHLKTGHALTLFPEGTRSKPDRLNRFRRGAFEAAVRAGVPLVGVFIRCDPLMLTKGQPFWVVPPKRGHYHFEILPIVETATDPRDGVALHRELSTEYKARFAAWRNQTSAESESESLAMDATGT